MEESRGGNPTGISQSLVFAIGTDIGIKNNLFDGYFLYGNFFINVERGHLVGYGGLVVITATYLGFATNRHTIFFNRTSVLLDF